MEPKQIFEHLKSKFGDSVTEFKEDKPIEPYIIVLPDKIDEVCLYLRDYEEFQFDSLSCLSSVDYGDGNLGVTYHLFSYVKRHKVILKVFVPKDAPNVKTVSEIWHAANWNEREAYDMMGIIFEGHKDLRRILLEDDWEGYPLRKDFQVPEFFHGMKVPY